MLRPIHTPLAEERIASALIYLETALAPAMDLVPLAVQRPEGVRGMVIVRLGDGTREGLTPDETRLMASCLLADGADARPGMPLQWAADLLAAADTAQRFADAVLATRGGGRGVVVAHDFRARR